MRNALCVFSLLLLAALPAAAQDTPKAEVSVGYSYIRTNPATPGIDSFNMNGGSASVAGNFNNWLGVVGDFGGYKVGKINGVDVNATTYTYLFGPRVSWRGNDRITPFAQVLFGGAHIRASAFGLTGSENAFALSAGGGVDVKVNDWLAIRPVQFEYLHTRFDEGFGNDRQHSFRYTGGIVLRFGKK